MLPRGGYLEVAGEVYRLYQKRLYDANAMDFDDLIMRVVDVFRLFPHRLAALPRRRSVTCLVDEYQDTNHAQYVLVKLLAEEHQQMTVVGDDDQSVYSWRGADIRNILEFERDFPEATVIKLEQNYRSTTTILEAANAVVGHNRGRKPKHLWTDRGQGEPLVMMECRDEHEEARLVAGEIQRASAGRPAAEATSPCSTASTPSRACWRTSWCGTASPTRWWAAPSSTSGPRSRTCWPTCAAWSTPPTISPSSAS